MNLLTIPLDEVTHDDLLNFCEEKHIEDIDLDYKADFPSDLARLLSAFANTQGGLAIIGVEEEGKTRLPVCPPKGIDEDADVARQKIQNIAFDAIYPPLEPAIRAVGIPNSERVVVLIRVHASNLVHAVDRRKRIYIRSQDNNRGYSLANLTDLQWLWDKRESSIQLREKFLISAESRAKGTAVKFHNRDALSEWTNSPHLVVSCLPAYPKREIIASTRELLDIANSLGQVRSPWRSVDRKIPWNSNLWRTIPSAVCLSDRGPSAFSQYVELGLHGHSYFEFLVTQRSVRTLPVPRQTDEHCVFAYIILAYIDIAIRFNIKFLSKIGFRNPILFTVKLKDIRNRLLHYQRPSSLNRLAQEHLSRPSTDDAIDLLDVEILAKDLEEQSHEFLLRSAKRLLWAFGIGWSESEISQWIE